MSLLLISFKIINALSSKLFSLKLLSFSLTIRRFLFISPISSVATLIFSWNPSFSCLKSTIQFLSSSICSLKLETFTFFSASNVSESSFSISTLIVSIDPSVRNLSASTTSISFFTLSTPSFISFSTDSMNDVFENLPINCNFCVFDEEKND